MDISEKKIADHNVALNDLSSRVLEVQCSVDRLEGLGTSGDVVERAQDCVKELEAIMQSAVESRNLCSQCQ